MNRKEKGYIYIFTIVLISILALFFYFIYSYTTNRAYINFNKVEKIQSKYAAESVLNMKISEESFYEEVENFMFAWENTKNLKVSAKPSDTKIEKLQIKKLGLNDKEKSEDLVELITEVKYKNSLAAARIKANAINKIYKEEDGILNSGKLPKDELELIRKSFEENNWSVSGKKVINLDGDFIYGIKGSKKYIFEEVEEFDEESGELVKKRNPLYSLGDVDVIIQKSGTLNFESITKNQIFILNDKVLFNDKVISGIIILNNNAQIVNNGKLEGYLIDLYDKNSGIDVEYHQQVLKYFGLVLPDYIKFQPISLNYYDLEDNT